MMDFVGNSKICHFLLSALEKKCLGNTYCFVGPEGVGKNTLARRLACEFLGCSEEKLDAYPDFFYLTRALDEKTGKKKKDILVEQTQTLRNSLSNCSWLKGGKVAIIDGAEYLNDGSGNSLLKILEEPSLNSLIILLTENDDLLLSTIRSRAQMIKFATVPEKEIAEALIKEGCWKERAFELAELSWGRPGRALQLFRNPQFASDYFSEIIRFDKIDRAPVFQSFKEMENILSEKGDSIKTKENLLPILDVWTMQCRKNMLEQRDAEKNFARIERISQAKEMLDTNTNTRLIIEQLLLNF